MPLTPARIATLFGGVAEGEGDAGAALAGVVSDSRRARPGCAFVALPGAVMDGHRFVADAARRGAALAVVSTGWEASDPRPPLLVRVADTAAALRDACRRRLDELGCDVVGITGSVGKTTLKEMCHLVLDGTPGAPRAARTPANLNTWTGIPLAVLELEGPVDVLVAELAMSAAGEIADLCRFTRPTIGVVLNVGLAHVGLLGSQEAIASAKAELLDALPPGGTAVCNADDPWVVRISARSRAPVLWFGAEAGEAAFRVGDVAVGLGETCFTIRSPDGVARARVPAAGAHIAIDACAAAAVASRFGVGVAEVSRRLAGFTTPPGRGRVLAPSSGGILYDDSYNSSPTSLAAALDVLAASGSPRRVAVLGDMLELGDEAPAQHAAAGRLAASAATDLVAVGEHAATVRDAAVAAGMAPARASVAPGPEEAAAIVAPLLAGGAVVLVKGSRALGLERAVARLSA